MRSFSVNAPSDKKFRRINTHFFMYGGCWLKISTALNPNKNGNSALFNRTEEYSTSSLHDILKVSKKLIITCLLTGIRLWCHIWHHFYFELCDCLITFPIFVPSQRLIARNVCELFSFNCVFSHLNEACRIDDVSRGSLLCYEILTNN
jgi:capsule polysaccharide export protein KpsC/LpsZ